MNLKIKNLLTAVVALFIMTSVTAQKKTKLEIAPSLVLTYSAMGPKGSKVLFPLEIKEMSEDQVVLEYSMVNGKKKISGQWIISGTGLENGKYLNWQPLNPSEKRVLPKDQTIFSVSRKFLDEIKSKKTAKYDDKVFELKSMPKGEEIKIGKKVVDAIYVVEKDGELAYWILNNRDLPFIINTKGGQGPAFTLADVTSNK
ncbi:hypothetical protein U8527_17690 [Kordia algicida OT-1]|uniref:Uncharacterized protein n=1 Tax=Kordia algicida OT-1 TaxID=391587 RepID=A9EDB0_9FLAO|nr:hypothetical protein [Kordia algicida]EDP94251.1 hypothetical protein KAOT1_11417 [Kordia algicida OT-1]